MERSEFKEGPLRRHITLSRDRGMVMELETTGSWLPGQQYILRCHKTAQTSGQILDTSFSDTESWTGFQYQDHQWSFAADPETVASRS